MEGISKLARQIIEIVYDFRQLLFAIAVILVAIHFRNQNLVDSNGFVDLVKNTVIAFMAVHGVENITDAVSTWGSNSQPNAQNLPATRSNDPEPTDHEEPS